RGALGNGLRVVAGVVLATGGTLVVHTRPRRLGLAPQHDGTTPGVSSTESTGEGARGGVTLGGKVADAPGNRCGRAGPAPQSARAGSPPTNRPSVHWHDADSFADLLRDAEPGTTVRQVLGEFDGLAGRKASEVAGDNLGTPANELSREQAVAVFRSAIRATDP